MDDRVAQVVDDAVSAFEAAGATVEEVSVGLELDHQALAELWIREIGMLYHSVVEGFKTDGIDLLNDHQDELCPAFVELLEHTQDLIMREYKRDELLRTQVYDAIQDVFEAYDFLVTPTLAVPPVKNQSEGQTLGPSEINGETVDELIGWCLTFPLNFTGHPAASIPAGTTPGGLPVGLQLVGDRFDDTGVLAASAAFERVRPWHNDYPTL